MLQQRPRPTGRECVAPQSRQEPEAGQRGDAQRVCHREAGDGQPSHPAHGEDAAGLDRSTGLGDAAKAEG